MLCSSGSSSAETNQSVFRPNLGRDGTEASTEILCSCLCYSATSDR